MTTHRATGLERVVDARITAPFRIEVTFDDGLVRSIDLESELWGPMFEPLKDPEYFARMAVDQDAGTIVWPNGADFAPEFLYEAGEPVTR
jgi:hypothetical protein